MNGDTLAMFVHILNSEDCLGLTNQDVYNKVEEKLFESIDKVGADLLGKLCDAVNVEPST